MRRLRRRGLRGWRKRRLRGRRELKKKRINCRSSRKKLKKPYCCNSRQNRKLKKELTS